ncbi:hypothetical protein [Syntrophomonas palmitatica]|uniref:hypothetical protein n=1 Tax=Syntrophomonas palmitatica TaxID=402877 RepID=UPI0006D07035|nr:hypothetical protein [Syntrophomonas palmitatica]
MNEKIAVAEKEKKADQQLKEAKALLRQGKQNQAMDVLKKIDRSTRAGIEAGKLQEKIDKS